VTLGRLLPLLLGAAALAGCGGSGSSGGSASSPSGARTASTSAAKPPPAQLPGAHKAPSEKVPILMYHVINTPPPGTPEPELWVPKETFAAQMSWLAGHGYHAVTLQQVWDAWHHGGLLPSRPIVVSLDDGYTSHYTNAFPILRSHGWRGTLNLQVNQTRLDLKPDMVRALIRAGWEIDAHTFTHPDLTTVDAAQLRHEVADSRTVLRRTYRVPVNFFCYPAGRVDDTVVAAVRAAGYLGATTTEPGLAAPSDDPYRLPRIRVNGSDGVEGLAKNLAAAGAPA
jgi:peptidoglycan/xylan/chitin deacetylase (PgdA/CDA1 family)